MKKGPYILGLGHELSGCPSLPVLVASQIKRVSIGAMLWTGATGEMAMTRYIEMLPGLLSQHPKATHLILSAGYWELMEKTPLDRFAARHRELVKIAMYFDLGVVLTPLTMVGGDMVDSSHEYNTVLSQLAQAAPECIAMAELPERKLKTGEIRFQLEKACVKAISKLL